MFGKAFLGAAKDRNSGFTALAGFCKRFLVHVAAENPGVSVVRVFETEGSLIEGRLRLIWVAD